MAGALLTVLAGAPSVAQAGTVDKTELAGTSSGTSSARRMPAPAAPSEGAGYAAREAATPELGNFKGGSAVIYIGGGTLVLVLIIVLIILVL